jgi:hypothetical protein
MAIVQNANDFVLFPRDQSYYDMPDHQRLDGSYACFQYNMAADPQQEFSELASSTYDSYPALSASYYDTPHLEPKDALRQVHQRYTPSASPSTSMSHSLDHAPSHYSHTSGASGHSAASSAVGSPYSHAVHEQWMDSSNGLGLAPSIVPMENYRDDVYSYSGADSEPIAFDNDKFSDSFVGELREVSSSPSYVSSPVISSPVSCPSVSHSVTFMPLLALDTSLVTRSTTIDTILEEINTKGSTPAYLTSPISCASPTIQSPRINQPPQSPGQINPIFRSPTTPASAMSPFSSYELFSTSETASMSPPVPPHGNTGKSSRSHVQNPFFSQSSGRFVAPLESSCWFSLRVLFPATTLFF